MNEYIIRNPDFRAHVTKGFDSQGLMLTFGAELVEVEEGRVVIEQAFHKGLLQQHGGLHGGTIAALLDTACGFSAATLLPAGMGITTVEFKTNFLLPGIGEMFSFEADVLKSGRTLTVSEGKAWAYCDGAEKLIATMTATMMAISL
jgi:uncharacterized protein (TIGR00369 family)